MSTESGQDIASHLSQLRCRNEVQTSLNLMTDPITYEDRSFLPETSQKWFLASLDSLSGWIGTRHKQLSCLCAGWKARSLLIAPLPGCSCSGCHLHTAALFYSVYGCLGAQSQLQFHHPLLKKRASRSPQWFCRGLSAHHFGKSNWLPECFESDSKTPRQSLGKCFGELQRCSCAVGWSRVRCSHPRREVGKFLLFSVQNLGWSNGLSWSGSVRLGPRSRLPCSRYSRRTRCFWNALLITRP